MTEVAIYYGDPSNGGREADYAGYMRQRLPDGFWRKEGDVEVSTVAINFPRVRDKDTEPITHFSIGDIFCPCRNTPEIVKVGYIPYLEKRAIKYW